MAFPDPCLLRDVSIPATSYVVREREQFTQYVIVVKGIDRQWEVRKRYSDFYKLHQLLCEKYPALLSTVDFPEKTLFNTSPDVIEERRKRLQYYLRQITMISIPANSCGGLNRMREVDLFLQVPQNMSSFGSPRSSATRSWQGAPQGSAHTSPEAAGGRSNGGEHSSSAKSKYGSLRHIILPFIDKQIENMAHCATSTWIKMFVRDCLGHPKQDPLEQLSKVREFVEDISEFFVEREVENLEIILQDWKAGGSGKGGQTGSPSGKHVAPFDVESSGSAANTKKEEDSDINGNAASYSSEAGSTLHLSRKTAHLLSTPNTPYSRQASVDSPAQKQVEEDDWIFFCACAREVIERYVILPQASDLLYRAQQVVGSADHTVKEKLHIIRSSFGQVQPELFGVPEDLTYISDDYDAEGNRSRRIARWDEPIAQLLAMEQCPLPSQMKDKLFAAVHGIQKAAQGIKIQNCGNVEEGLGADEFLPLFLYILALADLDRPATCYSYLQHLLPSPDNSGEVAYYLTTLESAVHFLMRLSLADINQETSLLLTPYPASAVVSHKSTIRTANIIYPPNTRSPSFDDNAGEKDAKGSSEDEDDSSYVLPAQQLVFSAALNHTLFRSITRKGAENTLAVLAERYWYPELQKHKSVRPSVMAKRAFAAAGNDSSDIGGSMEIVRYLAERKIEGVWVLYPGPLREPSYICAASILKNMPFGNQEWATKLREQIENDPQWEGIVEKCKDSDSRKPIHILLHQRSPREYFFQVPYWGHADAHWALAETTLPTLDGGGRLKPHSDVKDEHTANLFGHKGRYFSFKGPFGSFGETIDACIKYYECGLTAVHPGEGHSDTESKIHPNGGARTKSTGDCPQEMDFIEEDHEGDGEVTREQSHRNRLSRKNDESELSHSSKKVGKDLFRSRSFDLSEVTSENDSEL